MTAVVSRRGVLGAGAVALGVGITAGASAVPAASASTRADSSARADSTARSDAAKASAFDPALPARSTFAGHEGETYQGFSTVSAHELVLDSVDDLGGTGDPELRFRLLFRTDGAAADGIYRLLRDGELVTSLFLARVISEGLLEAVVDRAERA